MFQKMIKGQRERERELSSYSRNSTSTTTYHDFICPRLILVSPPPVAFLNIDSGTLEEVFTESAASAIFPLIYIREEDLKKKHFISLSIEFIDSAF